MSAVKASDRDGLEIAYQEWGEVRTGGLPPVVLHHGFVADADANWVATGVVDALTMAGRRVIAPDARGHGRSEKPHDPARYGEDRMARDLAGLLDVVGAPQIDLVGYSMGAIVLLLLASTGERVRRLVIGGVGSGVIECGGVDRRAVPNDAIVEALTVADASKLEVPEAVAFRQLADALGADREALAAQAHRFTEARSHWGASRLRRSSWQGRPIRSRSARRYWPMQFPRRRSRCSPGITSKPWAIRASESPLLTSSP